MDQHNTENDRTAGGVTHRNGARSVEPGRGTSMRHNSLTFWASPSETTSPNGPVNTRQQLKRKAFRLPAILPPMYPPHVSDLQIKHLIGELTVGNHLPSGVTLRTALKKQFGSRGGVARVYRLLAQARDAIKPPTRPPAEAARLEHELNALRKAATLAQHREEAHQTRWALEVDRLRQRLADLEPLALHAKAAIDNAELLRRQLHAAHMRISVLEQQLMENGHSKG
jgi:hypothetical protein